MFCRLLITAGHDTTAASVTWTLWELAKNPDSQDRLREDIKQARQRMGHKGDFTAADYDAMPIVNATIKVDNIPFIVPL